MPTLRPTPIFALIAFGLAFSHVSVAGATSPGLVENHSASSGPRLVRVSLPDGLPSEILMREGFDLLRLERRHVVLLEWPGDAARLSALGLTTEVLDATPGISAAARAQAELAARRAPEPKAVRSAAQSDGLFRIESLPPFGAGSMGGYWTTAEIKMKLDDLVASDAHGVVADKLDTLGFSWAGRPIWGLRLGKASGPTVFMNALTHAREPEGMQALLWFVDDLLGKYGTDPFATYLLDHRKLYIVPLVNPDGYAINESLYVASGGTAVGFWRKNVRDNDVSGTFNDWDGVDLNRNYGYQWGHDDVGSTPDPRRETYRGPSAFSEPETRSQRDVINALAPSTGLSFHTFGDFLVHPWGWTGLAAPHVSWFHEWTDEMVSGNGYLSGSVPEVLYLANGVFDDWAYGDTLSKPRAFTWTPEVGNADDQFWPPPSRIVPLADENLRACYVATAIAGPFVRAEALSIDEGALNASYGAHLRVRAHNLGLASTGSGLTATLVPLDPGVQMLVASVAYPALDSRQSGNAVAPFELAVDDTVTPGRLMRFAVDFTTPAGLFSRDTVATPLGTASVVAADDASSGLAKWNPGTWGIMASEPGHPSPFFADSPAGNYASLASNAFTWLAPLDLSAGVHAFVTYEARWQIESVWDALFVEASADGSTWTPLSSTGTTRGSGIGTQPLGAPLYAGTRHGWRLDRADLSAFAGGTPYGVRLRFRLTSDASAEYDGFALDSVRVLLFKPAAQPPLVDAGLATGPPHAFALGPAAPNPARRDVHFDVLLPRAADARLEIVDAQGRRVGLVSDGALPAGRHALVWDGRDASGRRAPPGIYMARLASPLGTASRRFVIVD